MQISVIISVYNRPELLELVLWGYASQTRQDFEIVIADDGSSSAVRDVAERVGNEAGLNLVHVWHQDAGFRKTLILNRAIFAAAGDYLIFTDGDCIPRSDLVDAHATLARPSRYVAGGYLKLPQNISESISIEDARSGRVADLTWLRARGWRPGRRALRLVRSRTVAGLLDRLTPTPANFHGGNASTWREAILEVNGFETEMGYGGLDRALGYRLRNAGVTGIQARHRVVAMHLHHPRPYKDRDVMARNGRMLQSIRRNGDKRARDGIAEMGPDATCFTEQLSG
jgi:glycosyltransferase involved in cell wall biosynthesis